MRRYEPFSNGAGGQAQRLTTVTCDWCGEELWRKTGQPWRQAMLEIRGRFQKFDLCPEHSEELVALVEERRDKHLTEVYRIDPTLVAEWCDETLDRSGALLGRIRELARR